MSGQQDGSEAVARVGIAVWVGDSGDLFDPPPVLGVVGELYLVELDAENRARLTEELVDRYEVDEHRLGIELAFFGDAGGFFASSISFLAQWPRTQADVPAEVFVDTHHRAAFTTTGDTIEVSVRHALRRGDGPPKRRLRFRSDQYATAISDLERESLRLRDELLAVAQQRAPEKVASLREAFEGRSIQL